MCATVTLPFWHRAWAVLSLGDYGAQGCAGVMQLWGTRYDPIRLYEPVPILLRNVFLRKCSPHPSPQPVANSDQIDTYAIALPVSSSPALSLWLALALILMITLTLTLALVAVHLIIVQVSPHPIRPTLLLLSRFI